MPVTSARVLSPTSRLRKLRAMSASEVAHRIRYAARIRSERRRHALGRLTPADRLQRSLVGPLRSDWERKLLAARATHRTRFFASVRESDAVRALFATAYVVERDATLAQATEVRAHRFEFFGQRFEYGDTIDWHADPVSGRRWPGLYHADVPVHGGDVGFGDVKYVWELSRQQFLIDLGKACFLGRNPEDREAIERLVRSWMAGNPYATGVNWSCALEPAFRVFSWLWAYYLTLDDLDEQFHLEWIGGFYDHARFLEQHLELYSSPYNHLMAEAAALYMVGACFPEFADATRWREVGRKLLDGRLAQQFYPDGGSVEQSPFYHHATVGFYLLAGILARATGDDLSHEAWAAIERGLDYSLALSQPDGKTPSIGGADDGKPIRMEHLPFWDFRPYLAIGAVLFERPDFKHAAARFHEDALWLLGPPGLARYQAIEPRPPQHTSVALPASGYYVLRSSWSPRADYVCFDCGEQAAGMRTDGIPNAMHGHADCLSVIAWLDGRRVLVDSGLYAYNCGGDWEAHFRETAAHNTAKVDGRDQARHIKSMAWTHSYRATPEGWCGDGQTAWAIGSHDGYARGPSGVVHRRAVWLRPDSYLVICDEFAGTGEHDLTVNYQFAPGRLEQVDSSVALFDGDVEIAWMSSEPWSATTACGGPGPQDGWIAPSLGIRQAAPRLVLRCTTTKPRTVLLTVIAARMARERRIEQAEPEAAHGIQAIVRGPDYRDLVATGGGAMRRAWSAASVPATDALLAIYRVYADGSVEARSTGGSSLEVDKQAMHRMAWTDRRPATATR